MSEISATVLYKQGHYLGACAIQHNLNCAIFNDDTPRDAWLSNMSACCGGDEAYKVTMTKPIGDPNALSGVWVVEGSVGYFLDGVASDVVAKCNVCCGNSSAVTPVYNGTFPPILLPLAKTYTVTRTDLGNFMAYSRFEVDYMDDIIDGTVLRTAYTSGVSTYVFQSYNIAVIPQRGDTVVQTARVFTSNTAPSLSGSNVYFMSGSVDNQAYNVRGTTSLSTTVTALNADALAKTFGTWAVAGSTITLTSTTNNYATLVLGQEA